MNTDNKPTKSFGFFGTLSMLLAIYFAIAIIGKFAPRDNTDPPDGRSGLGVYRDDLTGCEYLTAGPWPSSPTPRLRKDGTQVCR